MKKQTYYWKLATQCQKWQKNFFFIFLPCLLWNEQFLWNILLDVIIRRTKWNSFILLSLNRTALKENIILKRSLPERLIISCTLFTCPFSHNFFIDILSRVKDAYYQRAKTVAGLLDEELARLINDRQQRLAYTKLFYSEYTVNFVRAHGLIQVAFASKFFDKKWVEQLVWTKMQ